MSGEEVGLDDLEIGDICHFTHFSNPCDLWGVITPNDDGDLAVAMFKGTHALADGDIYMLEVRDDFTRHAEPPDDVMRALALWRLTGQVTP